MLNSINDECAVKAENSGKESTITITNGLLEKTVEDGPIFFKIMIDSMFIFHFILIWLQEILHTDQDFFLRIE